MQHDAFNTAVNAREKYYASVLEPNPVHSKHDALAVIDVQEDFCPPVSVSIYLL
jgi:hypothetical protein